MTYLPLSRKRFVEGLGAAAAGGTLAACGGGSTAPLPGPSNAIYDLIVVGAGISGIAAARAAQGFGAKVLVLEAQNRVGGRTLTDNTTFAEIVFDLGAQFFQQVLSGNELLDIANAAGIPTQLVASPLGNAGNGLKSFVYQGSTQASSSQIADFGAANAAIKGAVAAYGAAVAGTSADQALTTTLAGLSGLPYYNDALSQSVLSVTGVLNRSTVDLDNFQTVSPAPFVTPGDDYLIKSGMGNFIASLAKGLNVITGAPVKTIALGSPAASVTTAAGQTYTGKTIIVTASTNALASGAITFTPALPSPYTAAFASLPLTQIYKCLMGFRSTFQFQTPPPAGPGVFSIVVAIGGAKTNTFFVNFWGTNTVEFLGDGDEAVALETGGPAFARSVLLPALDATFPGAQAAFDGRMTQSGWNQNPFVGGAYAAALPNQNGARALLKTPISNQLWFAGEAVDTGGSRATLQGAYRSGLAAANGAMRTVGIAARAADSRP